MVVPRGCSIIVIIIQSLEKCKLTFAVSPTCQCNDAICTSELNNNLITEILFDLMSRGYHGKNLNFFLHKLLKLILSCQYVLHFWGWSTN